MQPLEPAEPAALGQQFKARAGVWLVHRGHAVFLSAEGCPVPRIAALLHVPQSTVHRWLDRFEALGVTDLAIQCGRVIPLLVWRGAVALDLPAGGGLFGAADGHSPER